MARIQPTKTVPEDQFTSSPEEIFRLLRDEKALRVVLNEKWHGKDMGPYLLSRSEYKLPEELLPTVEKISLLEKDLFTLLHQAIAEGILLLIDQDGEEVAYIITDAIRSLTVAARVALGHIAFEIEGRQSTMLHCSGHGARYMPGELTPWDQDL